MKKTNKFVYWFPRILSILFILFLALMSLDVFEENLGFWGTLLALLIHNIPTFVLLVILLISWKKEIVGAVGFIFAGLAYLLLILRTILLNGFEWYYLAWMIQISGIAFLIGILFFIGWNKRVKH